MSIEFSVGKYLWVGETRVLICAQKVEIISVSGQAPGACSLFFPSTHHHSNEFLSGECLFNFLFFFNVRKKNIHLDGAA